MLDLYYYVIDVFIGFDGTVEGNTMHQKWIVLLLKRRRI
jgi:hypothetical protein